MSQKKVDVKILIDYAKYQKLLLARVGTSTTTATTTREDVPRESAEEETAVVAQDETGPPSKENSPIDEEPWMKMKSKYRGQRAKALLNRVSEKDLNVLRSQLDDDDELLPLLLNQALSKSRRKVGGERIFYNFIYNHGLGRFITNKEKLTQHTPYKVHAWWTMANHRRSKM